MNRRAWLLLAAMMSGVAQAAPFDTTILYRQPDGTEISLHAAGDDFHADVETLDGYSVVFDPATKAYRYAVLSPDGTDLVPSGVMVGRGAPGALGIARHLRAAPETRRARARLRQTRWEEALEIGPRWEALKAARRQADAAAAAGTAEDGGGVVLRPPSSTTTGTKSGLCLLIDFSDDVATIPQTNVIAYCNGTNYTGYGNNGSVMKYFYDNSNGLLTYTNVVTIYIRVPQPKTYYNDTSKDCGIQGRLLINDALDAMKALTNYNDEILPTFSGLTTDASGRIAACNVYFAGANSGAWSCGLWPHSWHLSSTVNLGGGIKVYNYQITNIGTALSLGTFCHENGHMLCGFPDIYDYGYDSSGGAGVFCLMGYGGSGDNPRQVCAYLKRAAGWATTVDLTSASNLLAWSQSSGAGFNRFYRYQKPGVSTEYYLLENRQKLGRDSGLPAAGIAVWHVDELGNKDNQSTNYNSSHLNYEVSLMQADNLWHFQNDVNTGDAQDLYYLGNSAAGYANRFNDATAPSARWWDGSESRLDVRSFSASSTNMSFLIGARDSLVVSPTGGLASVGFAGGPFTPGSQVYALSNGAGSTVSWAATGLPSWASAYPASGLLTVGQLGVCTVAVNAAANAFPVGTYTGRVVFTNQTFGGSTNRPLSLSVVTLSRIIRLQGNLAFGGVATNSADSRLLAVWNDGSATLTVSQVDCPVAFGAAPQAFAVPPGGSSNVTVTFAPSALQDYGGTLTVLSDKTAGTSTIDVSGTGQIAETVAVLAASGPVCGDAGATLAFGATATNNYGHASEFRFDWDDGAISAWGNASHAWPDAGIRRVRAQARCAAHTNVVSDWSTPWDVRLLLAAAVDVVTNAGGGRPMPVAVTIPATNGTVTGCTLYYRPPGSTNFESVVLASGGGTWNGTIPPLNAGTMNVYVIYSLAEMAQPVQSPSAGTLAFTVPSALGNARFTSFEIADPAPWQRDTTAPGGSASSNWYRSVPGSQWYASGVQNVTNTQIGTAPEGGAKPCLLVRNILGAYLRSPYLAEGVGTLYLLSKINTTSGSGAMTVQVTADAAGAGGWETVRTIAYPVSNPVVQVSSPIAINRRDARYVRIYRSDVSSSADIWVDNVSISYPPADVSFTNATLSPAVPASGETVTARVDVASVDTNAPAVSRRVTLYCNWNSNGWNSLPMSLAGGDTFQAAMPGQPPGRVQYYARADFDGYYYTLDPDGVSYSQPTNVENRSPRYSVTNAFDVLYAIYSSIGPNGRHNGSGAPSLRVPVAPGSSTSILYAADAWCRIGTLLTNGAAVSAAARQTNYAWTVAGIQANRTNDCTFGLATNYQVSGIADASVAAWLLGKSATEGGDADGYGLRVEYGLDLDPLSDDALILRLASFDFLPDGRPEVTFTITNGGAPLTSVQAPLTADGFFEVYASPSLVSPAWAAVSGSAAYDAGAGVWRWTAVAVPAGDCFYRVVIGNP
jgi:M6 family metalloprotease-like protein